MAKANRETTHIDSAEEVTKKPESRTARVNCEKLNVRKKASLNGDVLTIIDFDAQVTIVSEKEDSDWVKVTLSTGETGFCMKEFLRQGGRNA